MIRLTTESLVVCSVCGQDAVRRTIQTVHTGGSRHVSYDTHDRDANGEEHNAALDRLDEFHAQLYSLEQGLNGLTEEQKQLPIGRFIDFTLDTVHPQACERRGQIIPTATIRAFGQTASVGAAAIPLATQTVESLLALLTIVAEPVTARLKQRHERGDF